MRDAFLISIALLILLLGLRKPFIFVLGYTWAEILTPQNLATGFAKEIPYSLIYAILASIFLVPVIIHRKSSIPFIFYVLLAYGFYMTASLAWSIVPQAALVIWEPAVKVVAFSAITILYLNSKRDVEAYISVIVLAGFAHTLTISLKTLLGGVGYGRDIGLVSGNSGFGEGSTVAMFAIYLIPLSLFIFKNAEIFQGRKLIKSSFLWIFPFSSLIAALGTHSRTGFLCAVLLPLLWIAFVKDSWKFILLATIPVAGFVLAADSEWVERMLSTIDSTESSAMGRVAVWKWTLDFIASNPFGGSFGAYLSSEFQLPLTSGEILEIQGKAFHSIYFEILGSLGYLGLFFFFLFISQIVKNTKSIDLSSALDGDHSWARDLRQAVRFSLIIFLFGGAFIGIAFKPIFFYLLSISVALNSIMTGRIRD